MESFGNFVHECRWIWENTELAGTSFETVHWSMDLERTGFGKIMIGEEDGKCTKYIYIQPMLQSKSILECSGHQKPDLVAGK